MKVTKEVLSPTSIKLSLVADQPMLDKVKKTVLQTMSNSVRVQGFRPGKTPLNMVEKHADQSQLQSEFLEQAVNELYVSAIDQERIRPVAQPQIAISKFVPFTTLEITAEVTAVSEIVLPDYTKTKVDRKPVSITTKQIDDVIKNLQTRVADKQTVKRAAKLGDELTIDFLGTDAKTHEPIAGADGKDYPLLLGSNNFIPGFEAALVGLKAKDTKDVPLTFPKDYSSKALQNKKVNFAVTVHEVKAVVDPKVDDAFAATVGPFKNVAELKKDIRRELEQQQTQENERLLENELLEEITNKTTVTIPQTLIDEEVDRLEQEERQNSAYRGQTWQEHLDSEGVTEAEHKAKNRPAAEMRVKAGLVLGEIAEQEKITVTNQEVDMRIQLLRGQYTDSAMQAELDKPENRRDIRSRLMTEKTLDKLKQLTAQ